MLTVTIEEKKQGIRIDVQVNPQQKIMETLKILAENNVMLEESVYEGMKIKSTRKKEYLHSGLTFEQSDIREGDILTVM